MNLGSFRARIACISVLVSLTAVLASCSPAVDPKPTADPSAGPTTAPVEEEPRAAFDGDCAEVLSTQALSGAVGEQMNVWEARWEDGADRALGGVLCSWASGQYPSAYASVRVYPVEVLDPEYIEGDIVNSCDEDAGGCTASDVFGDVWVGVTFTSERAAAMAEGMRALVEDIGTRAVAQPAPVPSARDGWWTPVPTCDDLSAALASAGMSATATEDYPAISRVFVDGPFWRTCTLKTPLDGVEYSTLVHLRSGAAGAVESAISANPDALMEHDGLSFATAGEQYPIDGATGVLLGAVGPNLVELDRRDFDFPDQPHDVVVLAAVVNALS